MRELLAVLAIIAVIAIIWYLRKESAKDAEQRKIDEFRRLRDAADAQDRAAASAAVSEGTGSGRRGGLLQQAVDTAAGKHFEAATGQLEEMTAGLAAARQQAERDAQRLQRRADETMAAVQAAAAAHGGAVPGDGTYDCPPDYPIKGNMSSRLYHHPHQPSYSRTIPEVCFQSEAAAEAAGFSPARDEPGAPSRHPAAGSVFVEEVVVVDVDEQGRVDVTDDLMAAEFMPPKEQERRDLVAEAVVAADAGSVPPGAIRGDGGRDCPPAYPIKGNAQSMIYHLPGTDTYQSTIPELCFSSAESAEAAGFRSTRH